MLVKVTNSAGQSCSKPDSLALHNAILAVLIVNSCHSQLIGLD